MPKGIARTVVCVALVGLGLFAAGAVIRFALLHDRSVPARIAGGSMAPALVGGHYRIACDDCGFPFRIDASSLPDSGCAVCPQCGFQGNDIEQGGGLVPGDRVRIDQATWMAEGPRRWGVVAVRRADEPGRLVVKRIVGLPGERMAIRDGEVYADGRRLQKSLSEFHQMAVLVHDNDYRPLLQRELPSRWRPEHRDGGWREVKREEGSAEDAPAGYRFIAPSPSDAPADLEWLVYQHWSGLPPPNRRTQASAVRDNYGYNQNVSRQLNEVCDLTLQLHLSIRKPGLLVLRYDDGRHIWEVYFVATNSESGKRPAGPPAAPPETTGISLRIDGRILVEATAPNFDWRQPHRIEFGLVDGQTLVAIDGRTELVGNAPESVYSERQRKTPQPFSIGAAGGSVKVSQLRILRDLYYLHGWQTAAPWEMDGALTDNEVFLLGDNCPVSRDSRNWPRVGVRLSDVLGYVEPRSSAAE